MDNKVNIKRGARMGGMPKCGVVDLGRAFPSTI